SRDWQRIAVAEASSNGNVATKILDGQGDQELLRIPSGWGNALLSSDGKLLGFHGGNDGWTIWDTTGGQRICALQESSNSSTGPTRSSIGFFSPDGKRLALPSRNGRIKLWNTTTGKGEASFKGPAEPTPRCQAFSPDGRLFASAYEDWSVMIWSTSTGEQV